MGIYSISDLFKELITSIDGFNALIWCILFIVKFFKPDIYGDGALSPFIYLLFSFVIILMFIRIRVDCHEKQYFNLGSFISVTFFSLMFIGR